MRIKGLKALAEALEVSDRTVRTYRSQGAPITKKYEAELAELHLWLAKKKSGGGDAGHQDFLTPQRGKEYEETRLKKLQADKLERQAAVEKGDLVARVEVSKWCAVCGGQGKLNLWLLQNSLPPLLEMKKSWEIQVILKDYLTNVCARMSGGVEREFKSRAPQALVMNWQEFITELRNYCAYYGIIFKED